MEENSPVSFSIPQLKSWHIAIGFAVFLIAFTGGGTAFIYFQNASTPIVQVSQVGDGQIVDTTSAESSAGLPREIGQCTKTTVAKVGYRLEDGSTGKPIINSGSSINYSNGGYQVSYDQIPGIDNSHVGDPVKLCLVAVPADCPPGDDRGKVYDATNVKTGEMWEATDSEHMCGGA